jgi:glycosyltransferase involved in cell wall biosynthesis
VKLAVVVQRYGAEINGGAELHARYVAELLARHADVEVVTTCAKDYVTWRNEYPPGEGIVHGVPVRRFPVRHERVVKVFGRLSERVFNHPHSIADELAWLDSEGPTSPALVRYLESAREQFDFFLFFSYRYYHAWHGTRAVPGRAVLIPTAERDNTIGLEIFKPLFRRVRALMYNSLEERDMVRAVAENAGVPGVVVGVGSEVPERPQPERFRQKFGLVGRFAIYVGRIDANKGCAELFEYFRRYADASPEGLTLVLVGNSILPVPGHPRIRHLGFLPDGDKFDALAAADVLIMPSYFESLSMVALEAWALGKPVLANGRCDVLKGQCQRSNAGLFYEDYDEFGETLRTLESNTSLVAALGENGRAYFRDHYAWPVIERKYLDMLDRLRREPADTVAARSAEWPLPGWRKRRAATLPPASLVLERIPRGPSRAADPDA